MSPTTGGPPAHRPAAARLRELLADTSKPIVCPGVYDGITARIALNEGFDCLYMTGAGTTMSRLGMPDLGVATLNDMRDHAAMIASLDRSVPLIADADTGYGGPLMVGRTVSQYISAGVAGLHLEDQVQTKRCGHLANKELVDEDVFLARIKAAIMAREQSGGDIVIIARTDALQGFGYDAAMSRLRNAVSAGADVAFLEGVSSKEQARQACQALSPTPVLLNMVPGGLTPDFSVDEAHEIGYRIIIYPGLMLWPVFNHAGLAAKELKRTGSIAREEDAPTLKECFEYMGLQDCIDFDKAAGGLLYSKGV